MQTREFLLYLKIPLLNINVYIDKSRKYNIVMDPKILFFIIKLSVSGLVSFLAILLMSKIRETAWTFLTCGFLLSYAAMIFDLLTELGILALSQPKVFEIPLSQLICIILPALCFIISFIIMLVRRS